MNSISRYLNTVLSWLDSYGWRLQLNKCKFMQRSVTYMGCVISAEGISPTEDKVEAIKKTPRPENCTQLGAFLGMINYHGKFIRNLSSILQLFNQLLQKDQELWSLQCEEAFNKAKKKSLFSSHVPVHYNPSLPVILESDTSQYGIGAVILHHFPQRRREAHRIYPRSLNWSEKNYSQIEKEGLAIIFCVTKYYMYLFGRKFTLRTDHKPLLKIFAPDSATPVLFFRVGPYSSRCTSTKLNSSLLLRSPALILCPDYLRSKGRMPVSRTKSSRCQ